MIFTNVPDITSFVAIEIRDFTYQFEKYGESTIFQNYFQDVSGHTCEDHGPNSKASEQSCYTVF